MSLLDELLGLVKPGVALAGERREVRFLDNAPVGTFLRSEAERVRKWREANVERDREARRKRMDPEKNAAKCRAWREKKALEREETP